MKKHRKIHFILGLIVLPIILFYSLSGIVLNHRGFFSGVDIPRTWLHGSYSYQDGRQAALRGAVDDGDRRYLYGDAGVWQEVNGEYQALNNGFDGGADNHKIYDLTIFRGELVAASHFGLWRYGDGHWQRIEALGDAHIVDLFPFEDGLTIMSRDRLLLTRNLQEFTAIDVPTPLGEGRKISLFRTLWNIHSGEIFGLPGKLAVDALGLVLSFLAVGGAVRYALLKLFKGGRAKNYTGLYRINRLYHIKVGIVLGVFLLVFPLTGMFLRPPLLIPIANVKVSPITGTHLDSPNPWADSLRKGFYDGERLVFSTVDGVYFMEDGVVERFASQPPISVMGANVFQKEDEDNYLVGSFSGLFLWNHRTGLVHDALTGERHHKTVGKPISDTMVSGLIEGDGANDGYLIDYNQGLVPLADAETFPLPKEFSENAKISLWNLALEVHTGRIFEPFIGVLYLLHIPLSGILILLILVTGYWWWIRARKGKTK